MKVLRALALILITACADEPNVELATINAFGGEDAIHLPDRALRGEPFGITVLSGGGCRDEPGAHVEYVDSSTAVVEVVVIRHECKLKLLARLEHIATLVFDEPGEKRIVVRGRGSTPSAEPREFEERVLIE